MSGEFHERIQHTKEREGEWERESMTLPLFTELRSWGLSQRHRHSQTETAISSATRGRGGGGEGEGSSLLSPLSSPRLPSIIEQA